MVRPTENGFDVLTAADASDGCTWKHRLQRLVKAFSVSGPRQKSLRHVETLSLGAKRNIYLFECEGQQFLVSDGLSAPVPLTQRFAAEERR
jgi:hypothetical protein